MHCFRNILKGVGRNSPKGYLLSRSEKHLHLLLLACFFSFFFLLIKCGLACSKNYLRGWVIIVVIELNLGFCSLYCIDRELPAVYNISVSLIMEFLHVDSNLKLQNPREGTGQRLGRSTLFKNPLFSM